MAINIDKCLQSVQTLKSRVAECFTECHNKNTTWVGVENSSTLADAIRGIPQGSPGEFTPPDYITADDYKIVMCPGIGVTPALPMNSTEGNFTSQKLASGSSGTLSSNNSAIYGTKNLSLIKATGEVNANYFYMKYYDINPSYNYNTLCLRMKAKFHLNYYPPYGDDYNRIYAYVGDTQCECGIYASNSSIYRVDRKSGNSNYISSITMEDNEDFKIIKIKVIENNRLRSLFLRTNALEYGGGGEIIINNIWLENN